MMLYLLLFFKSFSSRVFVFFQKPVIHALNYFATIQLKYSMRLTMINQTDKQFL